MMNRSECFASDSIHMLLFRLREFLENSLYLNESEYIRYKSKGSTVLRAGLPTE